MNIHPVFLENMKNLLGDEFEDFEKSLSAPSEKSFRTNTLKCSANGIKEFAPFTRDRILWCETGFFYDESQCEKIGKSLPYLLGLIYPQEASAMALVEMMDIIPGDRVLDLCAAPGGKSTQIAAKLGGKGLLVSNEIVTNRSRILFENIERCGVKNAVVLNEKPKNLETRFEGFFDKILVDAPCSGEGMFRKDPTAALEWTPESNHACSERQLAILKSAEKMLAPGGTLVYSTCTFSKTENENVISEFLQNNPGFSVCEAKLSGLSGGFEPVNEAVRAFPHLCRGEGHFMVKLKKGDGKIAKPAFMPPSSEKDCKLFTDFAKEYMTESYDAYLSGENVYIADTLLPDLKGLKFISAGIFAGKLLKNRFEPQHHLARALDLTEFKNVYDATEDEIFSYFKGNTLKSDIRGWCIVTHRGFGAGFAKGSDGMLKNHYPKGLRIF